MSLTLTQCIEKNPYLLSDSKGNITSAEPRIFALSVMFFYVAQCIMSV